MNNLKNCLTLLGGICGILGPILRHCSASPAVWWWSASLIALSPALLGMRGVLDPENSAKNALTIAGGVAGVLGVVFVTAASNSILWWTGTSFVVLSPALLGMRGMIDPRNWAKNLITVAGGVAGVLGPVFITAGANSGLWITGAVLSAAGPALLGMRGVFDTKT